MPLYFFHLRSRDGAETRDGEGSDLLDDRAAIAEAEDAAREMAAQAVLEDRLINGQHIVVADETGRTVASVFYRNVIRLAPGS